ncbi:MAG: hypothetical protein DME21_06000 [Verrucomicrobia bacterium]|nr:MAG: hypothetical protein DME21_06000 [Verrucomicrobiota bacterium]
MVIKNLNIGDEWHRLIMNSLAILVTRQPRGHNFPYHQLSRICAEMTVAALAAEIATNLCVHRAGLLSERGAKRENFA